MRSIYPRAADGAPQLLHEGWVGWAHPALLGGGAPEVGCAYRLAAVELADVWGDSEPEALLCRDGAVAVYDRPLGTHIATLPVQSDVLGRLLTPGSGRLGSVPEPAGPGSATATYGVAVASSPSATSAAASSAAAASAASFSAAIRAAEAASAAPLRLARPLSNSGPIIASMSRCSLPDVSG